MTTIYNINAGFLQTYYTYQGKKDISLEEVFKRLSFEMGGDGNSITKTQLDDYIDDAESGSVSVDRPKLNALKQIQKNWDTISNGKDKITYDDMKNYPTILAATLAGGFSATEIDDPKSSMQDAIMDYLSDSLGVADKSEVTKSDLTDYLNELITNSDTKDEANNNLIAELTNMIATYKKDSTIETEA